MQRMLLVVWLSLAPALMFAGTVSGKVTYTGTPAKPKTIDMSKEPGCARQYSTPPTTETVVTGSNNSLQNVVVYVSAGAPDESSASPQVVTFTQKGCRYTPHLVVLQTAQPLKVVNEDQTPRITSIPSPSSTASGTSPSRPEPRPWLRNSTRRSSSP
jgi:hypothetical protein